MLNSRRYLWSLIFKIFVAVIKLSKVDKYIFLKRGFVQTERNALFIASGVALHREFIVELLFWKKNRLFKNPREEIFPKFTYFFPPISSIDALLECQLLCIKMLLLLLTNTVPFEAQQVIKSVFVWLESWRCSQNFLLWVSSEAVFCCHFIPYYSQTQPKKISTCQLIITRKTFTGPTTYNGC